MTKKAGPDGGNGRLEEAIALLMTNQTALMQNQAVFIQNQATFNQNHAALLARLADLERQTAERFVRIETDIQAILRVLTDHSRLLQALPEAVRDKIGFKSPA